MKMRWISLLSLFSVFIRGQSYHHAGEFSIIQSPEGLMFNGQEDLDLSSIKNVLSTALGFSVPDVPRWSGLTVKDPFHFANAVVGISVPGIDSLDSSQGHSYPLNADEGMEETFEALQFRLNERYPLIPNLTALSINLDNRKDISWYWQTPGSKLLLDLAEGFYILLTDLIEIMVENTKTNVEKFGELNLRELPSSQHLTPLVTQDKEFLEQIQLLDAITTKLCSKMCNDRKEPEVTDGIPDIYWFTVPGLEPLLRSYSKHSEQIDEAKKLLTSSVLLLSEVFNTAYDYQGYVSDEDPDFPVMFNIFLWFNIGLVFALISVCYGIATMDPGRDSIIYRMTSNRMKKDN